jgi:hypothetical protein
VIRRQQRKRIGVLLVRLEDHNQQQEHIQVWAHGTFVLLCGFMGLHREYLSLALKHTFHGV